jgi:hypothetical protein
MRGAWVDQNAIIGDVGNTGSSSCTFPHLHFERFSGAPVTGAVDPGPLKACHGSTLVTYPNALGRTTWEGIPWGLYDLHSDGTGCDSRPRRAVPNDANGDGTSDLCLVTGVNGGTTGSGRLEVHCAYGGTFNTRGDFATPFGYASSTNTTLFFGS